ncbi:MAG: lytic transglycosylase domain-containing protein [Pseudomonadota bacterium]|nr:lytic transglycosylase domain-containing protein [Gammaproteobacteria bacterium]MBU1731313.1 lytic transglycosylase domain-containing protein [Gammaproteobacteria bacterium]MBU1892818.1 lytic transglycosylase domain-containing protein [Gammaproteobacteria bacterium]
MRKLIGFLLLLFPLATHAGAQMYEPLSASVRASLYKAVSDNVPRRTSFSSAVEEQNWLAEMSRRMEKRIPDQSRRLDFLKSVHYEASRAGLDPQLVLGLIQVESGFKKYAVSSAGARGYMQVMPFWVKLIGSKENNLFHIRTNLRFGCTILRHYLDIEKGDLYRALGRYNGSLGRPEYPTLVVGAWRNHWAYNTPSTRISSQDDKHPTS